MVYNLIFATLIILGSYSPCHSQVSVNASGNNICGDGGSLSYSLGQVNYTNNLVPYVTITEGVQQPILTPGIDTSNIKCYEMIMFDSNSCLFSIEGELPEEPTIVCFKTIGFDDTVCEWILEETVIESQETYLGCSGDQYSIIINENLYNESNSTGEEHFVAVSGCDSLVRINLVFEICDPCDGVNNSIGLIVSMRKDGQFSIKEKNGIYQQNFNQTEEIIAEIISIQKAINLNKSTKKQTNYSTTELYDKIAKLRPNSSVGL